MASKVLYGKSSKYSAALPGKKTYFMKKVSSIKMPKNWEAYNSPEPMKKKVKLYKVTKKGQTTFVRASTLKSKYKKKAKEQEYYYELDMTDQLTERRKIVNYAIKIAPWKDELFRIGVQLGFEHKNDKNQNLIWKYSTKRYNRFKIPMVNEYFQKGFAHVFFTRPDCNILKKDGKTLVDEIKNNSEFYYSWERCPYLLKQLTLPVDNTGHDFMLSLSNRAASFSLSDEYINTDTYGKTWGGWKISFGRADTESKTAGDFTITYNDTRNLYVYMLHKLWIDYIAGVYRGKYAPRDKYIKNHILDYACSVYYIITAEDGETILFWSKYYGVYPSTIPSTQYSWAYGNTIQDPKIEIKYNYSWKEDFNPEALVEFNMNSNVDDTTIVKYAPIYDPKLGHAGPTWVGAPYIELITESKDAEGIHNPNMRYGFKLRFRQKIDNIKINNKTVEDHSQDSIIYPKEDIGTKKLTAATKAAKKKQKEKETVKATKEDIVKTGASDVFEAILREEIKQERKEKKAEKEAKKKKNNTNIKGAGVIDVTPEDPTNPVPKRHTGKMTVPSSADKNTKIAATTKQNQKNQQASIERYLADKYNDKKTTKKNNNKDKDKSEEWNGEGPPPADEKDKKK